MGNRSYATQLTAPGINAWCLRILQHSQRRCFGVQIESLWFSLSRRKMWSYYFSNVRLSSVAFGNSQRFCFVVCMELLALSGYHYIRRLREELGGVFVIAIIALPFPGQLLFLRCSPFMHPAQPRVGVTLIWDGQMWCHSFGKLYCVWNAASSVFAILPEARGLCL